MYRFPTKRAQARRTPRDTDPTVTVRTSVPRKMYNMMVERAAAMQVPVGRLVTYAIYNELDMSEPFRFFDLSAESLEKMKVESFKPGMYRTEADILHAFLARIPSGTGLDSILLMRYELGLKPFQIFMGYFELLEQKRVELYWPRRAEFEYPETYRYVRVIDVHHQTMVKERLTSFEGRSVRKKLT